MGALSDLEMGRRWLQLDQMGMRKRHGALALPVAELWTPASQSVKASLGTVRPTSAAREAMVV